MDIIESLEVLRNETEDIISISTELENQAIAKMDELDVLRERFENIGSNITYYLENIENLQSAIDEFDNARDDASNYEVEL